MNRRESIKALGLLAGGNLLPDSVLANFLQTSAAIKAGDGSWTPRFVSARHAELLPELVDVIIPTTDTPGAKEALVHVFVDLYVRDCYPKAQQEVFQKGLDDIDVLSNKALGREFLKLSKEERLGLLQRVEKESWEKGESTEQSFIKMLKNLTLLGYFSSQPGATKAAEYQQSPGPFKGCVEIGPHQKVHAIE